MAPGAPPGQSRTGVGNAAAGLWAEIVDMSQMERKSAERVLIVMFRGKSYNFGGEFVKNNIFAKSL